MYKRLLTFLGDKQAPSMIRVVLPYIYLNAYADDILANYDFKLQKDGDIFEFLNILQFQHSMTREQFEVIKAIKEKYQEKYGFKIFYETDDLALETPSYNSSYNSIERNKDNIKRILDIVDCIACSTVELSTHMKKYNKTIIIKNRLIKSLWETNKRETFFDTGEKPKIIWCGGSYHFSRETSDGDFDDSIIDYINETSDRFNWIFFGSLPPKLKNNNKITFYNWSRNYFEYVYKLKNIKPDIGIALLVNNNFNRCKSNIKALEYTALNIPGVYSKITPYQNMAINVHNTNTFINQIELLVSDYKYYNRIRDKDYNTLKDSLYWNDDYCKEYIKKYLGD